MANLPYSLFVEVLHIIIFLVNTNDFMIFFCRSPYQHGIVKFDYKAQVYLPTGPKAVGLHEVPVVSLDEVPVVGLEEVPIVGLNEVPVVGLDEVPVVDLDFAPDVGLEVVAEPAKQ
jgi:hypothetical protein